MANIYHNIMANCLSVRLPREEFPSGVHQSDANKDLVSLAARPVLCSVYYNALCFAFTYIIHNKTERHTTDRMSNE